MTWASAQPIPIGYSYRKIEPESKALTRNGSFCVCLPQMEIFHYTAQLLFNQTRLVLRRLHDRPAIQLLQNAINRMRFPGESKQYGRFLKVGHTWPYLPGYACANIMSFALQSCVSRFVVHCIGYRKIEPESKALTRNGSVCVCLPQMEIFLGAFQYSAQLLFHQTRLVLRRLHHRPEIRDSIVTKCDYPIRFPEESKQDAIC